MYNYSYNNYNFPEHLSKEKQYELLLKYKQENCEESRDLLITTNLKLVKRIMYPYRNIQTINKQLEDLFQVGVYAIFKAIDTFDINRVTTSDLTAWTSWCYKIIQQELLQFIRKETKKSRINVYYTLDNYIKNPKDLSDTKYRNYDVYYDESIKCNAEDLVETKELYRELNNAINSLSDIEKAVVQFYWFESKPDGKRINERDIVDILVELGFPKYSRSYINRIKLRVIKKLRNILSEYI